MILRDMVFQGTVLGPTLWNLFFRDAADAIHQAGFQDIVYADDLNAFRIFDNSIENSKVIEECQRCQTELHTWGRANAVAFDPAKESMHVLSRSCPDGEAFKILGVTFDCKLIMAEAIATVHSDASWRLQAVLRTRRFHTVAEMFHLYKSKILSFVEYRTAAIYHACSSHLDAMDAVQRRFLRVVDVSERDALLQYNLAPLSIRQDIAMLGLMHRTVLKQGPPHFQQFSRWTRSLPASTPVLQRGGTVAI